MGYGLVFFQYCNLFLLRPVNKILITDCKTCFHNQGFQLNKTARGF